MCVCGGMGGLRGLNCPQDTDGTSCRVLAITGTFSHTNDYLTSCKLSKFQSSAQGALGPWSQTEPEEAGFCGIMWSDQAKMHMIECNDGMEGWLKLHKNRTQPYSFLGGDGVVFSDQTKLPLKPQKSLQNRLNSSARAERQGLMSHT